MSTKVTATVHRNFRDSETLYPKVLLTNVQGIDRDHCWVDASLLGSYIPRTNRTKLHIEFDATTKSYYSGKITIATIDNIKLLRK